MKKNHNALIDDNFLLETDYGRELYFSYAQKKPIIDYHSHLSPDDLAADKQFKNLTDLWIAGDHYKWRAMRTLGIPEQYITGKATDFEKFKKWAETVPYTLRNPLYHWTHLELKRYFNIDLALNPQTAFSIYEECNAKLSYPGFSARGLVENRDVRVVCTTDDPLDDLSQHKRLKDLGYSVQVLPTFRPDSLISIEKVDFNDYITALSNLTNLKVYDLESLKAAIKSRIDHFHDTGCRLSDHGLPHAYGEEFTEVEINRIFKDRLEEKNLSSAQIRKYKSAILYYLGTFYAEKDWAMQLHLGPIRDTNKALLEKIGINAGVDSIGDYQQAEPLAQMLNRLNNNGSLPRTILYNSNPADNEVFATMAGNFSGEGIKGKVQFGAAWWFLDQKDGITRQLDALSNMGLLSCSIGMLTDSRSFLSFPRHEYYRRILCNILGNEMQKGELPRDLDFIGKIVEDICYNNAESYFKFPSQVSKPEVRIKQ